MAVYTQLEEKALLQIAETYQLKVTRYAPVEGGASNSNYLLDTAQGKFMLTIVEDGTFEDACRLANLLIWLENNQFFTTRLRTSNTGKTVTEWASKPILLKKYIAGEVYPDLNEQLIEETGEALAQLHRVPVPDFIPTKHVYEQSHFYNVIGSQKDPEYETWLEEKLSSMSTQLSIRAPKGLIHGDLFPDNVLFKDGKIQTIIDFEEACFHYFIFDIGMSIIGLCMKGNQIDFYKVRSLLKGYQKLRPLENIEIKHLQFFTAYAAVKTSNWRFWKYHIQSPNSKRANLHRLMADIADKIAKIPGKHFFEKVFD